MPGTEHLLPLPACLPRPLLPLWAQLLVQKPAASRPGLAPCSAEQTPLRPPPPAVSRSLCRELCAMEPLLSLAPPAAKLQLLAEALAAGFGQSLASEQCAATLKRLLPGLEYLRWAHCLVTRRVCHA